MVNIKFEFPVSVGDIVGVIDSKLEIVNTICERFEKIQPVDSIYLLCKDFTEWSEKFLSKPVKFLVFGSVDVFKNVIHDFIEKNRKNANKKHLMIVLDSKISLHDLGLINNLIYDNITCVECTDSCRQYFDHVMYKFNHSMKNYTSPFPSLESSYQTIYQEKEHFFVQHDEHLIKSICFSNLTLFLFTKNKDMIEFSSFINDITSEKESTKKDSKDEKSICLPLNKSENLCLLIKNWSNICEFHYNSNTKECTIRWE